MTSHAFTVSRCHNTWRCYPHETLWQWVTKWDAFWVSFVTLCATLPFGVHNLVCNHIQAQWQVQRKLCTSESLHDATHRPECPLNIGWSKMRSHGEARHDLVAFVVLSIVPPDMPCILIEGSQLLLIVLHRKPSSDCVDYWRTSPAGAIHGLAIVKHHVLVRPMLVRSGLSMGSNAHPIIRIRFWVSAAPDSVCNLKMVLCTFPR